jgi:hypothetical protein
VTVFYPDVSNNNWGSNADAQAFVALLVPQGFAGVAHKVSEGDYYDDPFWPVVLAAAQAAGIPCLGYHYVTTDDPASQAQTWLGNGGGSVAMFDWEANGGNWANYQAVAAAFQAAGVTVRLGYIPNWYWSEVGEGDLSGVPVLVSSAYPSTAAGFASSLYASGGGDSGEGWDSYGNATPQVWQFTDAAQIGQWSVDCNACLNPDLAAVFGVAPAPAPAPPAPVPAPTPTPAPTPEEDVNYLTAQQQQDQYNWSMWTYAQLSGFNDGMVELLLPGCTPTLTGSGWPQLGQNPVGENLTMVDAVADIKDNITLQPTPPTT